MNDKQRILIIDDDEDILDLLEYNLIQEGFIVKKLSDSSEAIAVTHEFNPHLVILDILMIPDNGIKVCEMIRSVQFDIEPYIFFLTANPGEQYQSVAFNAGGDEFIEKIAGMKILTAKVKFVLNFNYIIRKRQRLLKIGTLEMHRGLQKVYHNGIEVKVSKEEFEILFFLAQNPGKNISIPLLTNIVSGFSTSFDENRVRMSVDDLMIKIGEHVISEKSLNLFNFNYRPGI